MRNVFENKGEGWEEKSLGEVIDIKHGYAFEGNNFGIDLNEKNPIVLTPGNFTEDCQLSFTLKNTKRSNSDFPLTYLFKAGELVIVMTDLSSLMKILGKPAIIKNDNILHNQRIGRVIFQNKLLNKKYLFYFFQTKKYLRKIKETATGTMVRHTAPKRILEIPIPFPKSLQTQQEIVTKLDALKTQTQALQTFYQSKLNNLEELKSGILKRAFEPQLIEA